MYSSASNDSLLVWINSAIADLQYVEVDTKGRVELRRGETNSDLLVAVLISL